MKLMSAYRYPTMACGRSTEAASELLAEHAQFREAAAATIGGAATRQSAPQSGAETTESKYAALVNFSNKRHITSNYTKQHAHVDVMHGGGDGFEYMVPVAAGDSSPPGHPPHLPPATLIPVRHAMPGHMQLGPPLRGSLLLDAYRCLVMPSAMWGEGDADFVMLHLTGPTCFHRNGAYLPPQGYDAQS